jgi:Spy/CpxP family protein refolding chaperone
MKIKPLLVIILAGTAIAASAQTQTRPSAADMAARQVKRLTTLLSLTSVQQQQATAIYTAAVKSEQALRESDKQSHDNLRAAVKNNDTGMIDQIAAGMAQTMAQLTSIHAKADAAFYQILTSDQQTKMGELESEHLGPLDGPGGPPPAMGFR